MTYENIRFASDTFAIDSDGYFCTFNTDSNIVIKTTQTGNVVFTYPSVEAFLYGSYGSMIDICYDGSHFWTLNREGSTRRTWSEYSASVYGTYTYDFAIKKWEIGENNTVNKIEQFDIVNANRNDIVVPYSFCVEAYQTVYSATVSGNTPYVKMEDHWDSARLESGDKLFLGPNSSGQSEFVTVTGTISDNTVGLTFYTNYTYEVGDPITFNKSIFLFNFFSHKVDGNVESTGNLMRYDPNNGQLLSTEVDVEYRGIDATAFGYISAITTTPDFYSLVYIKNNDAKFIDVDTSTVSLVMEIDNIQANGSTTIPVYNLVIHNDSLYRLQYRSMYYEADYTWTSYNYVLSPIREYVDSVTASVNPTILPSNGVSVAEVRAIVHDQYSNPIHRSLIYVTDDNDTGFISTSPVYTNTQGSAVTSYFSGLSPAEVTLTVTAHQVD